jgi:hypothetical protein
MNQPTVPQGLSRAIEQHQLAVDGFVNGDARLWKELCSKQNDVTIIGGWGGYERGWEQVGTRYE